MSQITTFSGAWVQSFHCKKEIQPILSILTPGNIADSLSGIVAVGQWGEIFLFVTDGTREGGGGEGVPRGDDSTSRL